MIIKAAHPRPQFSIADIVRRHEGALAARHALSLPQKRLLGAIAICRTPALGGHLHVCTSCGEEHPVYHSCRKRGCPICQSADQETWIQARASRVLKVRHFHVVFTLPSELRRLARGHPTDIYNALFWAVGEILRELAQTRMKATLGATMVLHTWTRDLRFHPHIHALVTAGGLSEDGSHFIHSSENYLFPVEAMGELLRGKMLDALRKLWGKGAFPEVEADDFESLTTALASHKRWVVYAQKPFRKADHLLAYLGRYTHRVGISNSRLKKVTEESVTFSTKDGKTATLHPVEFLRRFVQHVLPPGFHKIRHSGLYADGSAGGKLEQARALIDAEAKNDAAEKPATTESQPHVPPDRRCPSCGGPLLCIAVLPRLRAPPKAA